MRTIPLLWKSIIWIAITGYLCVLVFMTFNSMPNSPLSSPESTFYSKTAKNLNVTSVKTAFQSTNVTHPASSISYAAENEKVFPCDDHTPRRYNDQRGNYWVLYNYFQATKTFRCDKSVTYTTHAEWTFLDNLVPLLDRWQGPLSLALYSPGADFNDALKRIQYLRECEGSSLVKDFVTFHLFFRQGQVPPVNIPHNPELLPVNCTSLDESVKFGENLRTYRKEQGIPYPVNVARNIAREMATTHYVFPSDIELYPNPNLIPDFLDMIRLNDSMLQRPAPKVFVLPVFEVEANVTELPTNKHDLISMLQSGSAISFHKYICELCHRVPKYDEWLKAPMHPGLRAFHVGKRYGYQAHWEPFYIGTQFEPIYEERLTWEGRSDKMTQASFYRI